METLKLPLAPVTESLEAAGGAVLLGEAGFDAAGVGVEGGSGGGSGLGREARGAQEDEEGGEERRELASEAVHGFEDEGAGRGRQCKRGNAEKD